MTQPTIEVARGGKWYWRMVAANGQTMSHSETYYSKSNAMRAARSLSAKTGFEIVVVTDDE